MKIDLKQQVNLLKLKVKSKSLAAEAKIIRKEEQKLRKVPLEWRIIRHSNWWSEDILCTLSTHRRFDVRNEARATQLAIAYLKGKDYLKVEKQCVTPNYRDWLVSTRVLKMVQKYGDPKTTKDDILNWIYK